MKSKTSKKDFSFNRLRDFEGKGILAHLIIESSDDAIYSKTLDGTITSWNHGAEIMYGYEEEEMIGKNIRILIPPDMPNELPSLMRRISNGRHIPYYETKRIRKDGAVIVVSLSLSPINDAQGEIIGVAAVSRDITGRTQSERYARSLIEASLDPMVTISPDGKITDVNQATINVTGFPRQKLIGTDFSNYFTDPHKARRGYLQVLKQGFVIDYSLVIKSKDGKLTDVLYNATVYKDTNGKVLGVFAAARDVTAQKKLAEREIAERELEIQRIAELEKFQKLTVGRELKMIELKKRIEELEARLEKEKP